MNYFKNVKNGTQIVLIFLFSILSVSATFASISEGKVGERIEESESSQLTNNGIKDLRVFNQTTPSDIDGRVEFNIDAAFAMSKALVSFDLHVVGNTQSREVRVGQSGNVVLKNMPNGEYFNLSLSIDGNNFVQNESFQVTAAKYTFSSQPTLTTCSTISGNDCAGNYYTRNGLETGSSYNTVGSFRPCGFDVNNSCQAVNHEYWHCIDGNLSSPPQWNLYTETNYQGVGISALTASRLNWIICNYDYNASEVAVAIWYLTNTGGSSNSITIAAQNAVTSADGSENSMIFYKSNNSSYQDMVEYECRSTCNIVANAGSNETICSGESVELNGSANSGSSPYTYNWGGNNGGGSTLTEEAENGIVGGGAHVDNVQANYSGTGYIEFNSNIGEYVQMTVNGASNVSYVLEVRYAYSNSSTIPMNVRINGSDEGNYDFIGTGSGDNWEWQQIGTFTLNSGNNTVRLSSVINNGVDVDMIRLVEVGNSSSSSSITVSPSSTTSYEVTVTDSNGCTATDNVTVTVSSNPTANAGPDVSICSGSSVILTASGGASYVWSNGSTGSSISVSPATTRTYTVEVSDSNGCTATDEVRVIINNNPTATITGGGISICSNETAELTATGGQSYIWSTTATTSTVNVGSGSYTVTVIDSNGCTDSATATVEEEGCSEIGDYVFEDLDGDGIQDSNESGLGGVSFTLTGTKTDGSTAVTQTVLSSDGTQDVDGDGIIDALGYYNFTDITPGSYIVIMNKPGGFTNTALNAGGNDAIDNDFFDNNNGTNITSKITVGSNDDINDVDAGLIKPASIRGTVGEDTDGDGVSDAGIAGVTLTLVSKKSGNAGGAVTDVNGDVVDPVVTSDGTTDVDGDGIVDPVGSYYFGELMPSIYAVVETQPSEYTSVSDEDGSDDGDATDGNGSDPVNDRVEVTLTSGENDSDNDFIEEQLVSIGSMVFVDRDNSGTLDADETKLVDASKNGMILMELFEDSNNDGEISGSETTAIASTPLNADGTYFFGDLNEGNYAVGFTPPASLSLSSTGNEGDNQTDDDDNGIQAGGDGSFIISDVINLTAGTEPTNGLESGTGLNQDDSRDDSGDMTIDFGLYEPGAIRGTVGSDTDGDGVSDEGIAGVTLTLVSKKAGNAGGAVTDVNGDVVGPVVTSDGTTDVDGDGIVDPVGSYYFGELIPSIYAVVETQPADYLSVSDEDGSNDGDPTDGNANDPVNDRIEVVIESGETDETNDFVEEELGSISGDVTEDTDNDDLGDAPLAGTTVSLVDKTTGATVATVVTNAVPTDLDGDGVLEPIGAYYFGGLPAGTYTVVQNDSALPAEFTDVQDGDESNDGDATDGMFDQDDSIPVVLGPGEDDDSNDFIEEQLGSISGDVTEDTDNDDIGDAPLDGTTVSLVDKTTGATVATMATITVPTDLNGDGVLEPVGSYYFGGLPAGTYTIVQNDLALPAEFTDVMDGDETLDGDPTDGVMNQDDSIPVILTPGEDDTANDFIEEQLGSISGDVTEDTDNDDIGDAPLGGTTVTLIDKTTGATVATMLTNATPTDLDGDGVLEPIGSYYFGGLPAGTYIVVQNDSALPAGYTDVQDGDETPDGDATDGMFDQDDSIPVVLGPGEDDTANDFIEEILGSISGDVTEDTTSDGAGDTPLAGTTVSLIDKLTGLVVATMPTIAVPTDLDGDGVLEPVGSYYFGGLPAGPYTVVQNDAALPAGYMDVQDGDETNDGDPTDGVFNTDDSIPVVLAAGEDDTANDFIEAQELGSISGDVTEDTDNDDIGDAPLGGTTVSLIDKTTGATIATMATISVPTDLNGDGVLESVGSYYFSNLPAGTYTVVQNDSALVGYMDVQDGDETPDGDATDGMFDMDDSIPVVLTPGENDEDNNFVEEVNLSIGSLVWNDVDNDGVKDPTEDGIANVLVSVFEDADGNGLPDDINGDGVITAADAVGSDVTGSEVDTDGDGLADDNNMDGVIEPLGTYYIDQLPAGDYVVIIGTAPLSPKADGQVVSMLSSDGANLADDQTDNDDNGLQLDTDGDGIKDSPISSGTITLAAGTEPLSAVEFGDIESTNAIDSNGDNTIDFGFYIPAHLGNIVWLEDDANGVGNNMYDVGETLVEGATISLFIDTNGNGILDPAEEAAPIQTMMTDAFGEYEFNGLAPGVDYIVGFDQATATNVPGNALTFIPVFSSTSLMDDNSNVDPSCGCSDVISLSSGERNSTIDGGLTANSVVAIELADFSGRHNANRDVNELTWITANEINNERFIVERSFNSDSDFVEIGTVEGNGNSNRELTYNFDDNSIAESGLYIYRLRQVDYDGTESIEGPIGIRVDRKVKTSVNVYPNPARDMVNFEINSSDIADLKVTMYNVAGKVVVPSLASTRLESGVNELTVNLDGVPVGSYILRIQVGQQAFVKKLSVIK